MSLAPLLGPVQRPGEDRDMTEIFQRLDDLERFPPGRWIYAGTYPGGSAEPNTTPDSPPFLNGATGSLRFRRDNEWNTQVEADVEILIDGAAVVNLAELYRPDVDSPPVIGVGGYWILKANGDLTFTVGTAPPAECACDASEVAFDGSSTIPADNVQDAIEEVKTELLDHVADPVGAHQASAIGVSTPLLLADDVEEALEELAVCCAGSGSEPVGSQPGNTELIYRYTVTGSDKASIDTGADTADAGSGDWTNGDLLEVYLVGRTDDATAFGTVNVTLNNDTGSNYDLQNTQGNNTTTASSRVGAAAQWALFIHGNGGSANYAGSITIIMPRYEGTTFFKVANALNAHPDATAGNNFVNNYALGYRSTSAITRLKVAAAGAAKLKVGTTLLVYKRLAS